MNDESKYRDTSSPQKTNMFLPLHVESPGDPASGGDTPTKTATLSPVLLSPGSTTKKLIASGKIKDCFILLQKNSYLNAFTNTGEGALDAETVAGQTVLPQIGAISAVDHVECYKDTGLEATYLPDRDAREEKSDTTKSEGAGGCFTANRNIFTSFFRELSVMKTEGEINVESSDMDSTPSTVTEDYTKPELLSKCSEEAFHSISISNSVGVVTDSERHENARFLSDDVMSVSSTGSSETIKYPIFSEEDTLERFAIINDDEQETYPEIDAEDEVYEICDDPPRLESLESLPVPCYCLDHPPVLSPRLLMSISDDTLPEREESYVTVSDAPQNVTPFNNDADEHSPASSVGVEMPEPPVASTSCSTEINRNKSPTSPTVSGHEVFLLSSSASTKEQTERNEHLPRVNSTESDQSEQRRNELKSVINDVFFSRSSSSTSSSTETAFSNEETHCEILRDLPNTASAQEDQNVESEYQEILRQIADTSKDTAKYEGSTNQEIMYSESIPLSGSAEDLQITQVVRLGEGISTTEQDLSKEPDENVDIAPDVPNISGTKNQIDSMTVDRSYFTCNLSQYADVGSNSTSHKEAGESSAVTASKHSSHSSINSQTEIERAVASITDSRQSDADGAQDYQENIFDGRIEVAEVVINPQSDDSRSSTNEVEIMFSLDRRTSTDEEKGEVQSQDKKSKINDQADTNQSKGNGAHNTPAIQSNPVAHCKGITLLTTEKRHESRVSNSSCDLNVQQKRNSNENSQVVPCLHLRSSEPISVSKQLLFSQRINGSPILDSETQEGKAQRSDAEKNVPEVSVSLINQPHMYGSEIGEVALCGSQIVSNSSARSDRLSHTDKEMSQSKLLPREKQDHNSRIPDRIIEIRHNDSNSIETIPPSQDMTTLISNRTQNRSGDKTSFSRGADNALCPPLRSQEMDTAISLALMSEMTASVKLHKLSSLSNLTTGIDSRSCLPLPVHQDKSRLGEARTRHQSAPRMPGCMRQEGNPESNLYTPRRPNSTHGVAIQGVESSAKVYSSLQQATVKSTGRHTRGRYSTAFTFVDYSNPAPPKTEQFNEIKWHLMQERSAENGKQANTPHQAKPQRVQDWAMTVHQGKHSTFKNRQDDVSLGVGVPIEFPDGKRFMAYNKDALNYPKINCPGNQTNGHTDAQAQIQNQYSTAPYKDNDHSSLLVCCNQTVPQQVPQSAAQDVHISPPTSTTSYSSYNQQVRSINTRPNPSISTPSQVPHNLQTPRTATNALTGVYTDHQRQLNATKSHQSPSFGHPLHSMPQRLAQHVAYLPDQVNPAHGTASVLETHTCQEKVRSPSYRIPGGYAQTEAVHAIQTMQPTDHVPHALPSEPHLMVIQNARQYYPADKSLGQGQMQRMALTDNISESRNLQSTVPPRGDCTEAAIARHQVTAASRQAFDCPNDSYQALQRLFLMARGSAAVPNVHERGEPGHKVDTSTSSHIRRHTSQDYTQTTNSPTPERWTPTEQALLKSLPDELASYLINQHRKGIPMREALKTIVTSLLEEEGKDTRQAREKEDRDRRRVWHSTVHYHSSDALPHSDTVSSMASRETTHPTNLQYHNLATNALQRYKPTPSQENLMTQPQNSRIVGLSEEISAGHSRENVFGDSEVQQRQLVQEGPHQIQKSKSRIQRFYNPPPPLTPLLQADIAAPGKPLETRNIQAQVDIVNSPENGDSAIDLRTQKLTETSQHAHDGDIYTEGLPAYSHHSLSNSDLYHRAYTAGEPGPIRASSLVNLSSQSILSPATPCMHHSLSRTQLLIRNKLLERRSRIQSRSISTPDILHGYGYPNKRKRKRVEESNAYADEVLPPESPPPSQFHVSSNNIREIGPPVTSPSSTVKAIDNAGDAVQMKTHCDDTVYDLTIADSRESVLESNTLVHYPKLKCSLQSRWVTESVHPPAVSKIVHNQKEQQLSQSPNGTLDTGNLKDKELTEVKSAQDQADQTKSTTSRLVEQVACSEVSNLSDPNAIKAFGILAENALDTAAQQVPNDQRKLDWSKETKPPRKRKTNEASTGLNISCQFCSFQSFVHSDVRSHIKRDHFAKFQKNDGSSRRAKSGKRSNAAAKTGNDDFGESLPVSPRGVVANNNQTTKVIPGAKICHEETTPICKGQDEQLLGLAGSSDSGVIIQSSPQDSLKEGFVPQLHDVRISRTPIIIDISKNTPAVPSTVHVQPEMRAALAPHSERLVDEPRAAESTSLDTHPVIALGSTAKPSTYAAQLVDEQLHCSHCKLRCKNSKELHIHVKFQHTNTKGLHMCFNCGYTAKTKYGLRKHILKWHTQSSKTDLVYKCTHAECSESFVSLQELHRHSISHSVKRNFVCELCGAKYQYITGLRYHQLRHKLNYPHQCKQCGLKFKTVGVLHRHELQKNHYLS